MSAPAPFIVVLRAAVAALFGRLASRERAPSGRPAAAPTLGAFGLLASEGDPHRH